MAGPCYRYPEEAASRIVLLEPIHGKWEEREARIGIHTGPLVAGIVGIKKFAYDIWGDTVNIASRMETNGEAGEVNISATTYELIKDQFRCKYQGEFKENTNAIGMYFVEGALIKG